MKYLIILGVIAIIFYLLLFWRLRRYFPLARQIFGITRDLYKLTRNREGPQEVQTRSTKSEGEKLVRCASCGTWIPEARAVRLKLGGAVYCSTQCLERAAAEPRSARRSAEG